MEGQLRKYNLVGGLIFAGGFTEGFRQTGRFNPLAHFEMMEFGTETAKRNIPDLRFYKNRDTWPTGKYKGTDVVITNPHCSCWSPLGRSMNHGKDSWRTDPNLQYAQGAIQLFEEIQPKVWVWESVTQLATKGTEFLWEFTNKAMRRGYAVSHVFYDTKFMGLPQQRRRLFVVAHNIEIDWKQTGQSVVSLKPHLDQVEPDRGWGLRPEHVHVARELKPGDSLRYWWEQIMGPGAKPGPRFVDHRVSPDGPMGTVFGYLPPGYIHWAEERYLGPRELAHICGFPKNWWWPDDGVRIVLEVAKGVTPPAGKWLGQQVAEALDRDRPIPPQVIKANFMGWTNKIKDTRQRDEVYNLLGPDAVGPHLEGLIPDGPLQAVEKLDLEEEEELVEA
jgi:site-specific DNA-cytosine methylase